MNEKHIQCVLTVAQAGSITAASKKLYVSQPALSQIIKTIERELGAQIFDRSTSPISLTAAGYKYIEAAKKVMDIEKALFEEIHSIQMLGDDGVGCT